LISATALVLTAALNVRECLDAHECFAIREALDARDNTSSNVELSQMLYFPPSLANK